MKKAEITIKSELKENLVHINIKESNIYKVAQIRPPASQSGNRRLLGER